jgi:hypothetical protein
MCMRFLNNQKWAYQSISHEIKIPLLNDKQPKWMPLYSMSEINSRKSELTLTRISKRDSSDHQSHWQNTDSVCIKKEWHKATMLYRQLNKITKQDSYSLLLIKELQDRLDRVKWFTSLNLKEAYYQYKWRKDKNEKQHSEQDTDTTNTLLCCLSSRTPCHLSKVNQWHIERIPQWFCNHIPQWHSDIFRWP